MLNSSELSLCLVNKNAIQPLKDFKCRLENNFLREVSANIFDDDCYAFQPLYKLSEHDVMIWLYEVKRFVENGNKHVYAENALNTVLKNLNIKAISYENHYINEIDTPEDLARVQFEIEQFDSGNSYSYNDLEKLIAKTGSKKAFAVCGKHIIGSAIDNFLTSLPIIVYKYFNIQENPSYDAIRLAADKFAEEQCDLLISIGGGSAIDTTKGIKLFCGHENTPAGIKHIALPTTAGSGSEATQFAVIYRNGIKHALEHKLLLPEYAVLDVSLLYSLGYEQKRISLLDALCQCIESYWSLNSNEESRKYAQNGINMILQNYKAYIVGDKSVYGSIFTAANYSGKAINISRTTVGHAMSYQLTSKFGIKHGQAVAMCLIQSMKYAEMMFGDDNRKLFNELSKLLQCDKRQQVYDKLSQVYNDMNFPQCIMLHSASPEELAKGVNADRLNNTFFNFSPDALKQIYAEIINNYC
jgi:alcohol dehydrogenase class IV